MNNTKYTLAFCRGSNAGHAIYLMYTEPDGSGGGHRIAGPKCWGNVETLSEFELSESDIKDAIRELRSALKEIKKVKR